MLIQKQTFTPNDVSKTIMSRQSKHRVRLWSVSINMEINGNTTIKCR